MKTLARNKPYIFGALAGLLLTASVGITGQFFGTSTTFPRFATWVLDLAGLDLGHLPFYQVRDGALTGAAFPNWQLLFVIGIGAFIMARLTGTFSTVTNLVNVEHHGALKRLHTWECTLRHR